MNRPKKKTLAKCAILFVALVLSTTLVIHRQFNLALILSSLKTARLLWLIAGIIAMAIFFICEGINIGRCLKQSGYNVSGISQLRYALVGFFFSSITPSASGGQPMQLYIMHKDGISIPHASLALLTELMSFQAASSLVGGIIDYVCHNVP